MLEIFDYYFAKMILTVATMVAIIVIGLVLIFGATEPSCEPGYVYYRDYCFAGYVASDGPKAPIRKEH